MDAVDSIVFNWKNKWANERIIEMSVTKSKSEWKGLDEMSISRRNTEKLVLGREQMEMQMVYFLFQHVDCRRVF